ncbi:hypothetical protein DVV91_10435 [Clostridium botulinum]|uniref:hypothetical protein n=1 Tax=Clostridium botulinum TaxID=1491 RepID=UPI00196831E9|nr:hypothetical protein [Clostridium botulinum]MBN1074760.1 hypothetical protein [Clostridium botulinum]
MSKNIQQLIDYLEAVKAESGNTEVRVDGCVVEEFEDYIEVDHVKDYVDFVTVFRAGETVQGEATIKANKVYCATAKSNIYHGYEDFISINHALIEVIE